MRYPVLYIIVLFFSISFFGVTGIAQKSNPPSEYAKLNSDELLNLTKTEMDVNKNYPKALTIAKVGVKKYPGYTDLRFLMAKLYFLNKYIDSADVAVRRIIKNEPKYKDAYLLAANIELARNSNDEALCFIDDGLYLYPGDKDLVLKRFTILQTFGSKTISDREADILLNKYSTDTAVMRTYINYKTESAERYIKARNYARALYDYQKVLELEPKNTNALQGIFNVELKSGNYENAMTYINRALNENPNSYEYLMKKIAVYSEMKRYAEALDVLQKLNKLYGRDAKVQKMNVELRLEAGRYFMSVDPYVQFQSVLERSPSNKEALSYVINLAYSRGLYHDALGWINKGLQYNPNDQQLLLKKMGVLENLQKYTEAADVAKQVWAANPTVDAYRKRYIELQIQSGKYYMQQLEYDSARAAFNDVLSISPSDPAALNYSINILSAQKNYDDGIAMADKALKYYPDDMGFMLKKIGLLQDAERYDEAGALWAQLMQKYPESKKYSSGYVELTLIKARQMMQGEDYDAAYEEYLKILKIYPNHQEALAGIINLELARGSLRYRSALAYADQALYYYPTSKDFLLKKTAVLDAMTRYIEAYNITCGLMDRYPYNAKIKGLYIEEVTASGRLYLKKGNTDSALEEFLKVLEIKPNDSTALALTANVLNTQGKYDSSMIFINRGLQYYPGNEFFTLKRAVLFENKEMFPEAVIPADSVAKMNPTKEHLDYASYLRSKTYKNQIGLFFLNSRFDSSAAANIATIQYLRYIKRGSVAARLNFAGRSGGTGLQLDVDAYYNHNANWYSYVDLAVANKVFPKYKAAYSIFHTFKNDWEGELGLRYLNYDSLSVTSPVLGVARSYGDFWLNLRSYLLFAPGKMYAAATLTGRQYLGNKTDFIFATIGVGNSPDEFSRNYQLQQNLGTNTYSIGAGYQKIFNYRNTFTISGTWYNQSVSASQILRYRNQYDIYLSFLRKF
ncbi:tetratricopeptide repeat protein [Chitinophagaceae bacterium LWZ2-11]